MKRFAASIEYFGSNYSGWQKQKQTSNTIQEKIEEALSSIANEDIKIVCAGRTDSGVHAISQVIHFDTEAIRLKKAWIQGTNSLLPNDISINWIKNVDQSFNARFSALNRTYKYIVFNKTSKSIIHSNRATLVKEKLDIDIMNKASQFLIGENDFSSFRAAGCQSKTPMRNIKDIKIAKKKNTIIFEISANAFLFNMVRIIMGTLINFGANNLDPNLMKSILDSKDRKKASKTLDSSGLYFIGPEYPVEFKIPSPPKKRQIVPYI